MNEENIETLPSEMDEAVKEEALKTDTSNVKLATPREGKMSEFNTYGHRHGQLAVTIIANELIRAGLIKDEMTRETVKATIVEAYELLTPVDEPADIVIDKTIDETFASGFIKNDNGWVANINAVTDEHYTGWLSIGTAFCFGHVELARKALNNAFELLIPYFDHLDIRPHDIAICKLPRRTTGGDCAESYFLSLIRYQKMLKEDYRPMRFKQGVMELEENVDYVSPVVKPYDGLLV